MDPQISQRQPFGSSFASSAPAEERPKHGASGSTGAQQFLLDVWLYNAIDICTCSGYIYINMSLIVIVLYIYMLCWYVRYETIYNLRNI